MDQDGSTHDVVIVFEDGCPHLPLARERVVAALARVGAPPRWRELERSDPSAPLPWRRMGSPTVLVDGQDVVPARVDGGSACRLYPGARGRFDGAPSVDAIVEALTGEAAGARCCLTAPRGAR
jgi:hypothetical protein